MIAISLQGNLSDIKIVGGKALNLMKLKEFNVPGGICITTEAYDLFLKKNSLQEKIEEILTSIDYDDTRSIEENSKKIRKIVLETEMPEEILKEINAVNYKNVIVRSSSTAEDLPEASFAGQQETYINPLDLERAVKKCWASLWTDRAISYRYNKNIKKMPKIAVIIQEAIPCDISGVAFTKNPVNYEDEIVIEAVFGLGEALVSGKVHPDRYILDPNLNLKKKEIGAKEYKVVLSETGTERVKSEKKECLNRKMLKKIGETSTKIEKTFQKPQDIEFGIYRNEIYIFQSRDITTKKEDLWTRGYSDDYWTGVTSPLFFSLLGEFLDVYVNQEGNRIMGYDELEGVKLLRYHKAHAYFNTRVLRDVFKYNPKFSRVKELLDYFPEHEREEMKELPFNALKRLLAELRIAVFDWDGVICNTYKKYNKFSEEYLKKLKEFDKIDLKTLNDSEILEKYKYLYDICLKHYRLVRWGIATHNMGMNMILKKFIIEWYCKDPDTTHNILVSGLPKNKATETNLALFSLVKTKKERNEIFEKEFKEFLEKYGHRSYSRDIIFPRWAEKPELVLDIVNSLLENDRDIEKIEIEKRKKREELTKKVLEKIEKQKFGFIKKQIFKIILFYAQKYIAFRENQRFFLDHQSFRFRKIFLEIGKRLEERGILEEKKDVFFLFKEEVFDALKNGNVDMELLKKRKEEFKEYEHKLPPMFLQGNMEFDEEFDYEKEFIGVASSPGVVEGKIRLIRDIHELHKIRKDEIMVATCTDPGWTPVFLKIGGLITETGGILSHGAVVSREYGIPAVTGIKSAMKFLKDGDKVVLDGNLGKVYLR